MSIELFAGKSNIFESNRRSGKILSEIHLSRTFPPIAEGRIAPDPDFAPA
jgi:hypothetical protein